MRQTKHITHTHTHTRYIGPTCYGQSMLNILCLCCYYYGLIDSWPGLAPGLSSQGGPGEIFYLSDQISWWPLLVIYTKTQTSNDLFTYIIYTCFVDVSQACPGTDPDLQLGGPNYITGVWRRSPQWGPGAKRSPSEADDIFLFQRLFLTKLSHKFGIFI